jgi:hypothetical protein
MSPHCRGRRRVHVNQKQAGEQAHDISIDERLSAAEGDGRNGPRRVGPDAGDGLERGDGRGEDAAVLFDDVFCSFEEHAGAAVVAEAGPHLVDFLGAFRGERGGMRASRVAQLRSATVGHVLIHLL